MLNTSPPQVMIEAKFVEITQDDSRALGFDWSLGNLLMAGSAAGTNVVVTNVTGGVTAPGVPAGNPIHAASHGPSEPHLIPPETKPTR